VTHALDDAPRPTGLPARLAGVYFWYFAGVGVMLPYWSLYLAGQGLGPEAIGLMLALVQGVKLLAPMLAGWWADRHAGAMPVVRAGTALATLALLAITLGGGQLWLLVLLMPLFGFGLNAALPLFEATTMAHLGREQARYGPIRLWGSVGFILAAYGVGRWVEVAGVAVVPLALTLLTLALSLSSWLVPPAATTPGRAPVLGGLWREPRVLALLTMTLLMQASHGVYYAFYSIYLAGLGHSGQAIGLLWGLAVLAEVILFALLPRLRARLEIRPLLLWTFGLTVLRWGLLAVGVTALPGLMLIQCLHAFSFGSYHALSMALIARFFPDRLAARGQALYSSLGFGLGGLLASLAAGFVWAELGPAGSFWLSAGLAALAGLVCWRWLHPGIL